MRRRCFVQGLAAGAVGCAVRPSWAARTFDDETWTDGARTRTLPVRVRWPEGDGPCALIIHSHGLGGNREGGDIWGAEWRSAGFAVLHVQHPGSDTDALRGGMFTLKRAIQPDQLIARVADVRAVVDEVERRASSRQGPWSRVRLDALGASGHSFGAQTVQALAGQQLPVVGSTLREDRFRAFIAFSPAPGRHAARSLSEQFGAIERPFLVVTGSRDGDPLASVGAVDSSEITPQRRASVYEGLPRGRRALLWLDGADHMTFAGNAQRRLRARWGPLRRDEGAVRLEETHHGLVARATTRWWQVHLSGQPLGLAPEGLSAEDRWQMD